MRRVEIEGWALRVIEDVLAGRPSEDDRVELKSDWMPDDHDFARRVAGHANASRGEPILWLFGVDEKARAVPGVTLRDAAAWWPQVASCFDGQAPEPTQLNVRHETATVVAIFLETDRAPFVVKNPQFGSVSGIKIAREVPWRANTSVRTATREDLIRMLLPGIRLPRLEAKEMKATADRVSDESKQISLAGTLYLVHLSGQRIHIPDHLASGELNSAAGGQMAVAGATLHPRMAYDKSSGTTSSANPNFIRTESDITALGPGQLSLSATAKMLKPHDALATARAAFDDFSFTTSMMVELRFTVLGTDLPIIPRARLSPSQPQPGALAAWVFRNTQKDG